MLTGNKKKMVKDIIAYYISTTGFSVDNFLISLQRNYKKKLDDLDYKDWLSVQCYNLLKENDVTLSDCLEFRNLAKQLKTERNGVYLNTIWQKELCDVIESSNISSYVFFDVTSMGLDLSNVKEICNYTNESLDNFLNLFDFDSSNATFLNSLPNSVQKAILCDYPLFININPYLFTGKNLDILLDEMKLYGFNNKKLLNVHYGSLFKLIRICKDYKLSNLRIGYFGPLSMYYENDEMLLFYKFFKDYFKFNRGIFFNPKLIGVKDKSENIGYFIWDKKEGKDNPVVLEERIQQTNDIIIKGRSNLLRGKKESLYEWVSNSIIKDGLYDEVPKYLNIQTKTDEKVMRFNNTLGYLTNSKNLWRSLNKVGVFSVPIGEYTEITYENFNKSIASYSIRSCLQGKLGTEPIYLSTPDVLIRGYDSWLADSLVLFLFDSLNMTKSYRGKEVINNRLFPLSFKEVKSYVNDTNLLQDMNVSNVENLEFLKILKSFESKMTEDGRELYKFGKKKLIDSLLGKTRENAGYKDSLVAWDASFYQIRDIPKLFTTKDEDMYIYLLSKLKDKIYDGIYKYGFIMMK